MEGKEIQERVTPAAWVLGLGDGLGGRGREGSSAATRSRSRSRAPSHTSVDPIRVLAQNPGKLPTPGTATLPHPPPVSGPDHHRPPLTETSTQPVCSSVLAHGSPIQNVLMGSAFKTLLVPAHYLSDKSDFSSVVPWPFAPPREH